MDDWHNGSIQGIKNTVAAKNMKKRAAAAMAEWLDKKDQADKALRKGRKLRGRRRRLIAHKGQMTP